MYHDRISALDLEKFPPTSSSIVMHIKRAYLQAYMWYHSPFTESIELKPEDFGYLRIDDEYLVPEISNKSKIPELFPQPCKCQKCARKNVCGCRIKSIVCCKYCKCGAGDVCQNVTS